MIRYFVNQSCSHFDTPRISTVRFFRIIMTRTFIIARVNNSHFPCSSHHTYLSALHYYDLPRCSQPGRCSSSPRRFRRWSFEAQVHLSAALIDIYHSVVRRRISASTPESFSRINRHDSLLPHSRLILSSVRPHLSPWTLSIITSPIIDRATH